MRDDDLRAAEREHGHVHVRERRMQLSSRGSTIEPLEGAQASDSKEGIELMWTGTSSLVHLDGERAGDSVKHSVQLGLKSLTSEQCGSFIYRLVNKGW